MATQAEYQTSPEPVSKDIFISYSRRDKAWVDDYLKRLLKAADVEFMIDEEDFEIGELLDESIRKAVKECRYTLFVMTPDWVRGKWTHFESLLALDNEADKSRHILAIKLRDCEVPPHVAPRLYLDLCAARERDQEIVKLLQQIGVSKDRVANALNSVAKKTLLLLMELLEEPQVREKVSKLREMFLQIQRSNDTLVSNKQLHDDLQDIQMTLSQLPLDSRSFDTDRTDWGRLRHGTSALCEQIDKLLSRAAAVRDEFVDASFVDSFRGFSDELDDAIQSRDARRFLSYLTQISRQLDRSLPRMNDRIVQHIKERRLGDLVQSLEEVYHQVVGDEDDGMEFDDDTTALLDGFRSGIETLVELDCSIRERVDDHSTLQEAEMDFQQMIRSGEPTFYDISMHWNRVSAWIRDLKLTDRYQRLLKSFDQLSEQLNDDRSIRDDQFEDAVKWNFAGFVHETRKAFNKLDIDLLAICKGLKPHGDGLQQILNRMHSDDARN
ncbi:MAG: TIR domain-containing protein [Candidatus Paceibacterota bacterium]